MFIRKKFEPLVIVYLVFAVFSFWMAAQLPYTNDDWDWGLSNGIDQLLHATINSRYVGNFFAVIMTRSIFLKTLIIGLGYFLIPFFISRFVLLGKKASNVEYCLSFVLAAIMLFTMPKNIWAQTFGWVSGFANYGISALFVMFWMYQVNISLSDTLNPSAKGILFSFLVFILSLAGQLFIENLAIFNAVLSVVLVLIYKKRVNKVPAHILIILFGTFIGLGIMFSSKLYGDLLADGNTLDGVRRMIWSDGTAPQVLLYNFSVQASLLSKGLYENNVFVCLFTLLILCAKLLNRCRNKYRKADLLFLFLNIIYIFYFSFGKNFISSNESYAIYKYLVVTAINLFYYFLVLLEIILLYSDNTLKKYKLILIWSSAPLLIAPLIFTLDNGARLYFTSNLFLYIFCLVQLFDVLESFSPKLCTAFSVFASVMLLCFMLSFGVRYHDIGQHSRERTHIIEQALTSDDKEIIIEDYPHDDLLWASRPYNSSRVEYFKKFYGIPDRIDVQFTEYIG